MKSFSVLSAYNISSYAFKKMVNGISPFEAACRKAADFPECKKLLILTRQFQKTNITSFLNNVNFTADYEVSELESSTPHDVFSKTVEFIEKHSDFENIFFLHADMPFIDLKLTEKLFKNHIEYRAEYSFTDGYPIGLCPEIVNSGLCRILAKVSKDDKTEVGRTFIFDTIKKDINNYDIETVISPNDLRYLRLSFTADTKRNFLLCNEFTDINSENYAELIKQKEDKLFTIPAYYGIEINPVNPFNSIYKPEQKSAKKIMEKKDFFALAEKISNYSDDAVISLSIFGEPLLHPDILEIIEKILSYPNLSVLIETTGSGWRTSMAEKIAELVKNTPKRKNGILPVYFIICIDAVSSAMYANIHRINEDEANIKLKQAVTFADSINKVLPSAVWVQIIRMNENESEVEPFYRFWKELNVNVIIQKFDTYCKQLDDKRVADLSPFERRPCWHLKRDMYILSNGTVPLCKEDIFCNNILGNAFSDNFDSIREKAFKIYKEHLNCKYGGLCEHCDEYYTYNF